MTDNKETKQARHGHVTPRPDGVRARCGGPAVCRICQAERAEIEAKQALAVEAGVRDERSVLADLLRFAERQICTHEETHRGGAIWEICDSCGAKWADDEGGKPEFKWPDEIEAARAALARASEAAAGEPVSADAGERKVIAPVSIHRTHPNQAYATLGFDSEDDCSDFLRVLNDLYTRKSRRHGAAPQPASEKQDLTFQSRVRPWMMECFGAEISADQVERNHRFFEEASELVQACGMTASEAHQLVDYTWSRPIGEPNQEAGGVMVTLAALCLANGLDMHAAGETELARINKPDMVIRIRAKQAAKPKHSPLPAHPASEQQAGRGLSDEQVEAIVIIATKYIGYKPLRDQTEREVRAILAAKGDGQ